MSTIHETSCRQAFYPGGIRHSTQEAHALPRRHTHYPGGTHTTQEAHTLPRRHQAFYPGGTHTTQEASGILPRRHTHYPGTHIRHIYPCTHISQQTARQTNKTNKQQDKQTRQTNKTNKQQDKQTTRQQEYNTHMKQVNTGIHTYIKVSIVRVFGATDVA